MLHPGEVGPSEELLRLKAIVETLESRLHAANSEVHKAKIHESVLTAKSAALWQQVNELRAENTRLQDQLKDTMVV
jgi:hypothetical protein